MDEGRRRFLKKGFASVIALTTSPYLVSCSSKKAISSLDSLANGLIYYNDRLQIELDNYSAPIGIELFHFSPDTKSFLNVPEYLSPKADSLIMVLYSPDGLPYDSQTPLDVLDGPRQIIIRDYGRDLVLERDLSVQITDEIASSDLDKVREEIMSTVGNTSRFREQVQNLYQYLLENYILPELSN